MRTRQRASVFADGSTLVGTVRGLLGQLVRVSGTLRRHAPGRRRRDPAPRRRLRMGARRDRRRRRRRDASPPTGSPTTAVTPGSASSPPHRRAPSPPRRPTSRRARDASPCTAARVPPGTARASTAGRTACGRRLTTRTLGVAHKTLPCGTLVELLQRTAARSRVPVIDRGPFRTARATTSRPRPPASLRDHARPRCSARSAPCRRVDRQAPAGTRSPPGHALGERDARRARRTWPRRREPASASIEVAVTGADRDADRRRQRRATQRGASQGRRDASAQVACRGGVAVGAGQPPAARGARARRRRPGPSSAVSPRSAASSATATSRPALGGQQAIEVVDLDDEHARTAAPSLSWRSSRRAIAASQGGAGLGDLLPSRVDRRHAGDRRAAGRRRRAPRRPARGAGRGQLLGEVRQRVGSRSRPASTTAPGGGRARTSTSAGRSGPEGAGASAAGRAQRGAGGRGRRRRRGRPRGPRGAAPVRRRGADPRAPRPAPRRRRRRLQRLGQRPPPLPPACQPGASATPRRPARTRRPGGRRGRRRARAPDRDSAARRARQATARRASTAAARVAGVRAPVRPARPRRPSGARPSPSASRSSSASEVRAPSTPAHNAGPPRASSDTGTAPAWASGASATSARSQALAIAAGSATGASATGRGLRPWYPAPSMERACSHPHPTGWTSADQILVDQRGGPRTARMRPVSHLPSIDEARAIAARRDLPAPRHRRPRHRRPGPRPGRGRGRRP